MVLSPELQFSQNNLSGFCKMKVNETGKLVYWCIGVLVYLYMGALVYGGIPIHG